MTPRRQDAVSWILAVVIPAVGCVAEWVWISTTTTAAQCSTGAGGGYLGLLIVAAAALVTPVTIWWQGRRSCATNLYLGAIVFGLLAGGTAPFLTGLAWWSGHGCMT